MGQAHALFRLLWGPSAQGGGVCVSLLVSLGCNPSSSQICPGGHRLLGCSSPPLSLQVAPPFLCLDPLLLGFFLSPVQLEPVLNPLALVNQLLTRYWALSIS